MNIVLALLVFTVIIFVHELGHFFAARRAGILVEEFSIGMGPRLLKWKPGDTMYSLKLFPIGGSCMMLGEDESDAEPDPRSFNAKPVKKRMGVILAGAIMNFILAIVVGILIASFNRFPEASVQAFTANSALEAAGAQVGDRITRINGRRINVYGDFMLEMQTADGSPVALEILRDGQRFDITLNPTYLPDPDGGRGRWLVGFHPGIGLGAFNRITETDQYGNPLDITQIPGVRRLNFGQSLARGINEAVFASRSVFFVLRQLFTGQLGMDVLMGPVGIVDAIGGGTAASLEVGVSAAFWTIMNFVLIISANLGVLNLLPIPALDGGRMIFLILEAIRGKPIKPEREGIVHLVGFVLLMGLAVFIAYNDIVRLF